MLYGRILPFFSTKKWAKWKFVGIELFYWNIFNVLEGQNKNKLLFPAPDRLLENVVTGNIIWVIWRCLFCLLSELPDRKFPILFQNLVGTGLHCFIWSKSIARPGKEPDLCYLSAALKLRCCKCDVEWHVGYFGGEKNPLQKWRFNCGKQTYF